MCRERILYINKFALKVAGNKTRKMSEEKQSTANTEKLPTSLNITSNAVVKNETIFRVFDSLHPL